RLRPGEGDLQGVPVLRDAAGGRAGPGLRRLEERLRGEGRPQPRGTEESRDRQPPQHRGVPRGAGDDGHGRGGDPHRRQDLRSARPGGEADRLDARRPGRRQGRTGRHHAAQGRRLRQRRQDRLHRGRRGNRKRDDPAGRWRQPVRRRRQTLRGRLVRAVRRTRPRGHRDLRLRCAVRRGQEEVPAGASGAQGRPGDQEPAVRGAAAVVDGDRCAGGGRGGVAGPAAASRPLRVTGLAEPRVSGDRAPVTGGARSRGLGIPYPLVLALLAGLVLVAATAGIAAGSVSLPPGQVWGILLHSAHPALAAPDWPPARETIVLDVRLPRVLLCAVVGAGLSVCGMALQALVRNPLADPMLLGVSSGATVGAVLVVVFHMAWFGRFSLPLAAFGGALLALVLVYFLAQSGGRMTTVRLVLAG